jgi:hypothetical protein
MFKKLASTAFVLTALVFAGHIAHADQVVTERVLNHHLQSFGSGNVAAIMEDYTDKSVIIVPNGVLKGREQIQGLFNVLVAEFSKPGMKFNLTNTKIDDHLAYITWNAETQDNVYNFATDTFVVRGGKIFHQTVAFDVTSKK